MMLSYLSNRLHKVILKKLDQVGGLIWLILGVGICIESCELELGSLSLPGPGLMPFLAGALMALCGLVLIMGGIFTNKLKEEQQVEDNKILLIKRRKNFFLSLLILFGYGITLEYLGFILTSFLFLFSLFKLTEGKNWLRPIVLSLCMVFASYLLFFVWLKCPFPNGIFKLG